MTKIGITPCKFFGIDIFFIHKTQYPTIIPPTSPPTNPAFIVFANVPIARPGAIPGLSAKAYAVKAATAGTVKFHKLVPINIITLASVST